MKAVVRHSTSFRIRAKPISSSTKLEAPAQHASLNISISQGPVPRKKKSIPVPSPTPSPQTMLSPPELPPIFLTLQPLLLHATNILALAIGPQNRVLQLSTTLPALVLLVAQSWYREWNGQWGMQYGIECMVFCMAWGYVDWIVLGSPDREGWCKIRYGSGEKRKEEGKVPQGFWKRAYWGLRLAMGVRYVGWSCEVKNVPVEVDAGYPRW
jgi:hypothetical protein